jgi:hypothetical protein
MTEYGLITFKNTPTSTWFPVMILQKNAVTHMVSCDVDVKNATKLFQAIGINKIICVSWKIC